MFPHAAIHTDHPNPHATSANLNGIDLVKFICAFLVLAIHFPPIVDSGTNFTYYASLILPQSLCRIAVPFYFVCSGFFLFRKMPLDSLCADIIKNYCYKLLRLLSIWKLLLIIGATDHLWYLSGTVVAVILLSLCLHFRFRLKSLWLLAGILYGIGLLGDSYHGLITPLLENSILGTLYNAYVRFFGSTRNGIFMGFIFVLLGASLAQHQISMRPMISAIGFAISMVALMFETLILDYFKIPIEYNMYICLLPAVYFLFCFACTVPLKSRSIYKHLRNIGMWIYFLHKMIGRIIYVVETKMGHYYNIGVFHHLFIFSSLITLLIAVLLVWLSGKEKFKWLNWLIS